MVDSNGRKHAVILPGGGAYGAFEVGAMKAIFTGQCASTNYQPLNADIFTGTSVGAVNASFMVSQPGRSSAETVMDLEDLWLNRTADDPRRYGNGVFRFRFDLLDFFNIQGLTANPVQPFAQVLEDAVFLGQDFFSRAHNFFLSSDSIEHRILDLFNLSSFVTIDPLWQLLTEQLSLEGIRQSDKILRIIATNWETGEAHIFGNEDMTDEDGVFAIMASAAIPGFVPPVNVKGQPAVDGGIIMSAPLLPAIRAGAEVIHMIYLDPAPKDIPLKRQQSTMDTIDRMLTIQFAIKINENIEMVNWVNQGLEVMERVGREGLVSDDDKRTFIRAVGVIERSIRCGSPYKKITVHRYRPRHDLGGFLGMLNFSRPRITELIDIGYKFATEYNPAKESIFPQ
jgi:predicted acylesterase/phospholipase RssA